MAKTAPPGSRADTAADKRRKIQREQDDRDRQHAQAKGEARQKQSMQAGTRKQPSELPALPADRR
jgi:hypothetical protein